MPGDSTGATEEKRSQKRPRARSEQGTVSSESSQTKRHTDTATDVGVPALVAMLRAVASGIEQNPALARAVHEALLAESADEAATPQTKRKLASPPDAPAALDPFAVLREQGAPGLRQRLEALELAALRTIVRSHRLDPARISSRWTSPERLAELIVEQVQARARLGSAFERV